MQRRRGETHPFDPLLKSEVLISAWCPGCGIGTVVNVFLQSVARAGIDPKELYLVAGMGCTGRIIDGLKVNGRRVADGLSFEYATRYKQKNPARKVVVFLNDADFITNGVDRFVEAARAGSDILVIYVNNFIYPIVHYDIADPPPAGQSVYESREYPFNIPHLALSCGAHHIARWTTVHTKRLSFSIAEALRSQEFSIIEVLAPCLMYCVKEFRIKESTQRSGQIEKAKLDHDEATENLDLRRGDEIVIGRFSEKK
jgi:2-oxoglutarate ferredoxin oxidoreductase subunit beta